MAAASSAGAPSIRRLSQEVVNRIAAGEVVHRPANAVKEMLENSLDAGATNITITAKGGGLKFLQIQDNGHGIRKEDMGIVCERFTTSKLREFGDLNSIQTYGFRGEALASISHVARLTITTMTRDGPCAFKASYLDGAPVPAGPGGSPGPQPCAGVPGTQITVEDVFYNMPTRLRAFRSPSEEYNRIIEVVTRYAVHCGDRGVAFTCRKHGSSSPDVHSPASKDRRAVVRHLYGAALAKELLDVSGGPGLKPGAAATGPCGSSAGEGAAGSATAAATSDAGDAAAEGTPFAFSGLVSNANYSMKRRVFILFINGRLVDCPPIRKAVEAVFSDYLPKGTHPWVYLRLDLPGDAVDVNVHPTKREVHFLGEDEVVEAVSSRVADVLMGANASRSFFAQTLLPGATAASQADPADGGTLSGRRLSAGHRNAQAPRQSLAAGDAVTVTLDHRGHAAAAGAAEAGSDLDQSDGDDSGVGAPAGKRRRGRAAGLREGNGRDGGASTPADGGGSERRGAGDGGDGRSHNDDGAGGHGDDGGGDDDEGGGDDSADDGEEEEEEEDAAAAKTRPRAARPTRSVVSKAAGYPSKTVRTDSGMQTLTRFLSVGGAGVLSDAVAAEGGQRGLAPAGSAGGGRLTSARSRAGRAAELRDFAMTAVAQQPGRRANGSSSSSSSSSAAAVEGGEVDDCCDDGEGGAGAAEIDIDASCDVDGAPVAKRLRQAGGMDAASAVASAAGVGRAGAAAERTARRAGASPVRLTSVRELRAEAERATHKGLTAAVRKHTFVGVVDEELSLVQFGTKLLLVNHLSFARELMYQQALRLFAGMHSFELRPAPGVRELVLMALEGPDGRGMDEAAKGAAADAVASLLESKAEMLSEYFGVGFRMQQPEAAADSHGDGDGDGDEEGADNVEQRLVVATLPRLVDGHSPCLDFLPEFVLAMAYDVDWEDEKGCFQTVAAVLAELYARVPSIPRFTDEPFERPPASGGSRVEAATKALRAEDEELLKLRRQPGSALWVVEQVLWPAFRFGLTPSRALAEDHNVIQIACTEQLYRVFERC
ncbi:hypothetical protein FNF31_05237 [Cafeteria roenbergensis]|uniref:DNA mismatch repair protein S5 domain-containing protein n=1 Tax=Cafeteria roenbergensis TaxID=33653 RepID=A0A5A8D466_CAFRO|nr:hypothetical protein FNF31_05237 [Cafeteria roenbergensis]